MSHSNIAYNKAEALQYKGSKVFYEYDRHLLNTIFQFHTDIGASRELPTDKGQLKKYLIRLHETLSVNNPLFPEDVDFGAVYADWMVAVVYEEAKRYGNNISALARCFNEWYKLNADKYIKSRVQVADKKSRSVSEFTNVEIARLYEIITVLNGGESFGLFNNKDVNSFCRKVRNEYKTRGLNHI